VARRAHSLATLLRQVNERFPGRDKASDGWVGDEAHRVRVSDHNPNAAGVVQAQDFDEHDADGNQIVGRFLWDRLLASRDPRVKYVVYEERMFSSYPTSGYPAWTPRPGKGHTQHLHLSVVDDARLYDDASTWNLGEEEDDVALSEADWTRIEDLIEQGWQKLERRIADKHLAARDPLLAELVGHARADASRDASACEVKAGEVADELARRLAE
jgi:hypothetical protein